MVVSSHDKRAGGKLPRGPHRLTEEQVSTDQRRRLIDAMIQLTGERGYAATAVADVTERAEVSRKTFYEHFKDRRELLLAAFDAVSPVAFEEIRGAAQRTGGPTRQLESLMLRLTHLAREAPDTIGLSTIEIAAVNPDGVERRERMMGAYGHLLDECLGTDQKEALPPTLDRTLAAGAYRTIDAHLRMRPGEDLASLAKQLARWTRSYHPASPLPMAKEMPPAPWRSLGGDGLLGGRAPGTLTLSPRGYEPPQEARSKGFIHQANRERILDAVAQLTAADGYTALTAVLIAERADISERAFLAHFKNKDDAFASAVEVGHMKGQAVVERARASAPDWATGVRNATYALLEFLASEPYFTRLAFVDAPLAGPTMTRRTYEHVGAYARLLLDGAPQRRRPPPVAPEAIVHGLFELAFHQAAGQRTAELTSQANVAAYLALAPFVGTTDAAKASAI